MALLRKTTMVSTVIAVAVLGFALPAAAFQEQRQGAPAAGAAPAAAPQPGFIAPTTGGDAKSAGGTEVRVPGLGKLGSLPKLDFGLELLYGAAEDKPVAVEPHGARTETRDDDLTIRGTVRHKF